MRFLPCTHGQIANAFRKAKENLAVSWSDSIETSRHGDIISVLMFSNIAYCEEAAFILLERMNGVPYLFMWLEVNVPEYREMKNYPEKGDALQEYSHRWIDSLIEEFSQEPDKCLSL